MGVFKAMQIEKNLPTEEELFLSENFQLQERIRELINRIGELRDKTSDHEMKRFRKYRGLMIPKEELDKVLPHDFWDENNIRSAIRLVQGKLLSLWMKHYGALQVPDGQMTLFDFSEVVRRKDVA